MPKKIFIIACEASADLHSAALIHELKKSDPSLECRGLGGPQMAQAGMSLIYDMTQMSALGFGDVIRQYFKYRKIFYQALREISEWHPTALILVDSPAFNLRIAKKIRKTLPGLSIFYYICPQIWAWGHRRIHDVKKSITKMFSIFPFEVKFYREAGVDCEFVGHPLLEHAEDSVDRSHLRKQLGISDQHLAIGLLPGSRKSEVERILPIMLKTVSELQKELPQTTFFLASSPNIEPSVYNAILEKTSVPIHRLKGSFNDGVKAMDFALVTSGTATLQTALANTPFFLLYKTSWSTYMLGKQLIRVPYLGIVNLLAGKAVVPEFIQRNANPKTISHEAKILLTNQDLYNRMRKEFSTIREELGKKGASANAAKSMLAFLDRQDAPRKIPVSS